MPTIEERLQRLEDIEAIQRLQIRYAELCDDGFDPDAIVDLFTPDGVWDCGDYGRFVGETLHQDIEQADVEVGNLKKRTNRQRRKGQHRRRHGNQRRAPEDQLIRALRDNVFFEQQLHCIGDGL